MGNEITFVNDTRFNDDYVRDQVQANQIDYHRHSNNEKYNNDTDVPEYTVTKTHYDRGFFPNHYPNETIKRVPKIGLRGSRNNDECYKTHPIINEIGVSIDVVNRRNR